VSGRPKREKTAELTVESAETWENGGRTSETWHWSVAKWRNGKNGMNVKNRWNGKNRLSVTVESAENVGKRCPHGRKRGKTVVAWPKWSKTVVARPKRGKTLAGRPKRGKTVAGRPKRRENGGTLTETGERDPAARFTALQWETAKRRENVGRTDGGCENRGQAAETEENGGTTDGKGQKLINVPRPLGSRPIRWGSGRIVGKRCQRGRYGGNRGRSAETEENGGTTMETDANGSTRPDARFTAVTVGIGQKRRKTWPNGRKRINMPRPPGSRPLRWETAKRRENGGRTVRTC